MLLITFKVGGRSISVENTINEADLHALIQRTAASQGLAVTNVYSPRDNYGYGALFAVDVTTTGKPKTPSQWFNYFGPVIVGLSLAAAAITLSPKLRKKILKR